MVRVPPTLFQPIGFIPGWSTNLRLLIDGFTHGLSVLYASGSHHTTYFSHSRHTRYAHHVAHTDFIEGVSYTGGPYSVYGTPYRIKGVNPTTNPLMHGSWSMPPFDGFCTD